MQLAILNHDGRGPVSSRAVDTASYVVLGRMADLLRGGWTQFVNARGPGGAEVPALSRDAVCFCYFGAQCRAAHELLPSTLRSPLRDLVIHRTHDLLGSLVGRARGSEWNDQRGMTQDRVVGVVETMRALLRAGLK